MNVACPGCGTRYAVADEKVRGRRVRISCKHCGSPIIVDGTAKAAGESHVESASGAHSAQSIQATDASVASPSQTVPRESHVLRDTTKPLDIRQPGGIDPSAPRQTFASGSSTSTVARAAEPSRAAPVVPRVEASTTSASRALSPAAPKVPAVSPKISATAGTPVPVPVPVAADAQPLARIVPRQAVVPSPLAGGRSEIATKASTTPVEAPSTVTDKARAIAPPDVAPPPVPPKPPSLPPLAVSAADRPQALKPNDVGTSAVAGAPGAIRAAKPRAMHATIIGVAAPANPPPAAVPPPAPHQPPASERTSGKVPTLAEREPSKAATPATKDDVAVSAALRRPAKRTMIGGLDAAPGSAPLPQAVGLGIPAETKWTVLLADSGASVMSAPDVVRAFAEGRVNRDAKLWREGLDGWKSLSEIEPIRLAFQRAGIDLDVPASESSRKPRDTSPGAEPGARMAGPLPEAPLSPTPIANSLSEGERSTSARPPAKTELCAPPTDPDYQHDASGFPEDDVTRVMPSPWSVQDAGAGATSALASSAGLPPRQAVTAKARTSSEPDEGELEHPKSRPDIGPRDTVRGELHPLSSLPPSPSSNESSDDNSGLVSPGAASPLAHPDATPNARELDDEQVAATERALKRRRSRRRGLVALIWLLALSALVASLTVSYRTRQPKAVYAYLHRKHWDIPLDLAVQRYVSAPYRRVAKQVYPYWRKVTKH